MRIDSIISNYQPVRTRNISNNQGIEQSRTNAVSMSHTVPVSNVIHITFAGNDKNIHQMASICPENKGYGIPSYNLGGLAVVAQEAPDSWRKREKMDVRNISPYHTYGNNEGGIRVVKLRKENGKYVDTYDVGEFLTAKPNETLEDVRKRYNIPKEQELSFVIQHEPNGQKKSKITRIEDTGIKKSFERPSANSALELEKVDARLFKAIDIKDPIEAAVDKLKQNELTKIQKEKRAKIESEVSSKYSSNYYKTRPSKEVEALKKAEIEKEYKSEKVQKAIKSEYDKAISTKEFKNAIEDITKNAAPATKERNATYFVHTKDLSRFQKAYATGYSTYNFTQEGKKVSTDVMMADFNRAVTEIMPELNTEAHGKFNPANYWLHDRPSFMTLTHILDKSKSGANDGYYNGLKIANTYHNPGRDYQGWTEDPFEMFRMVASKEDVQKLQKHSQYTQLKDIESHWWNASNEERKFVRQIFDPYFAKFIDGYNTYNISMIPVAGTQVNPDNMSAGTVSNNYDKEMKSAKTPEIADGMTSYLAKTNTISPTNGSTPASMRLDDPNAGFCRGREINGLTEQKAGFTTYKYDPVKNNIDEVVSAKKKNTKWFLDALAKAYEKDGNYGIIRMFFSDNQMYRDKANVMGHLSKYQEGDVLLMGWGRPDQQKGLPSTFKAFLEFLKDDNISLETKKHTKLIAGAGVWDQGQRDYKLISKYLREIEQLGFEGNVCYVDGFFPNRLVGCATYSIFSSRYEPCGITPLESFAAGTPVISNNTGGAPDFIEPSRGYLTENPYLRSPEDLGITKEELEKIPLEKRHEYIDNKRLEANSQELKKCINSAVTDYSTSKEKYTSMVKDAITQKVDWHNNGAYNRMYGSRSANRIYMDDVFEIGKGTEARNKNPLNRLVGDFGVADEIKGTVTNIEEGAKKSGNKWLKIAVPVALALGGVATYFGLRGGKNAKNIQKLQPQPNVIPQEQTGKIEEKPQEIVEENIQETVAEMPQNIIAEKTINITTADFDFRPSIDKEEEMPRLYRVG